MGNTSGNGTLVLVLGILSIICLPLLGPVAWIMGNGALKRIDEGVADPSQRGAVGAGRICGMIGTVLLVLGIVYVITVFTFGVSLFKTSPTVHPGGVIITQFSNQSPSIDTQNGNSGAASKKKSLSDLIMAKDAAGVNAMLDQDPSLANKKGPTGETPLFDAAFVGSADIANALIAHGADVNAADDFGKTALDKAKFFNHAAVVTLLESHGATAGKGSQ